MKRLLFISYAFPPILVPESTLSLRTVRGLVANRGWEISVLAADARSSIYRRDESLVDLIPPQVKVRRVSSTERYLFPNIYVYAVFERILDRLGLPEMQYFWYAPAVRGGLKIIDEGGFDAIHSWATYHTCNMVGLALKRKTGLPWVAHLSDPWVDNPYRAKRPKRQLERISKMEREVMAEADRIVFTTQQTVDLVMSKYPPTWREKACVVPHGYDLSTFTKPDFQRDKHRALRLIYTGDFYGIRTPAGLLKGLKLLNQRQPLIDLLEVHLIGFMKHEGYYKNLVQGYGLEGVVHIRGIMPYMESLKAAAGADALLLVDAPGKTSVFLPSKLVDYLMFKKPIIGFTPLEGASADLLRRLDHPIASPDDSEKIAAVLGSLIDQWKRDGELGVSKNFTQVAEEYDIRNTTVQLESVLESSIALVNGRKI